MCKVHLCAAHVQASAIPHICAHVCYLCTRHALLAHMQAIGMLHIMFLACIHYNYYSTAYMPLAHMQATSIPHMCSLHTCMLLQCCIHAVSRRFISGINTKFSRVLHTQKLKHATYKYMRCAEYMHVKYFIHTVYTVFPRLERARSISFK